MNHLTDTQIQAVADGTLRGPEGMAAREHCDSCVECGAELALYSALAGKLSALEDPEPPADFTATVLAAVEVREQQLAQRRHLLLAALPAAALALFAIAGSIFYALVDVGQLLQGIAVLRTVVTVLGPVIAAVRLPLGIGAFVVVAIVLTALSRTLRPAYARIAGS